MITSVEQDIVEKIDDLQENMVKFLQELVRIPSVNPPGEGYHQCAELLGDKLKLLLTTGLIPAGLLAFVLNATLPKK